MTRAEYDAFVTAVCSFYSREGVSDFSCRADCCPSFSWQPFDCCRRPLGGDRHEVTAYHEGSRSAVSFSVCEDCVYFAAYGRLDDTTMMGLAG